MYLSLVWVLFFSLFIALQGCVTIPTDEAVSLLNPIPSLTDTVKEALLSTHFQDGEFPKKTWWEIFDDPELSSLIVLGLKTNPTLKQLQLRVETAEQEAKIKRAALFPILGANANIDWQYLGRYSFFRAYTPVIPPNVTEYNLGFDLSYDFDFWGRNRNIYKAALGQAKAAEAEWAAAELGLATSIAIVYMQMQANMAKLDLLKQERKIFLQALELTASRQEHALDSEIAYLDREKELLVINQLILALHEDIALLRHSLQELIGEGPELKKTLDQISLHTWKTIPLPKDLSLNLLARRPDLVAQLWHVEGLAHLVGAAKADFYPNINLTAFAGLDSIIPSKLFTWQGKNGWAKPALYLPIFTGGKLKANLRARQAEFRAAIAGYNAIILRAVKEVADQIVTLSSLSDRLMVEEKLLQNRAEDMTLYSLLYKKGIHNLYPFLHAEEKWLEEKANLITLQANQAISLISLIKALGGGYFDDGLPLIPKQVKEAND